MQIACERRSSKAHGLTGAMAVLGALAWSTAAMAWTGQPLAYGAGATGGPSVPVLDTGNNTVVATLPCCQFSAISPDSKYLYSFSFLSVGVIDTASGNVIATIPIPPSREAYAFGAIAVSPDGKSI
jgi:YVTN family beta-propeller protein